MLAVPFIAIAHSASAAATGATTAAGIIRMYIFYLHYPIVGIIILVAQDLIADRKKHENGTQEYQFQILFYRMHNDNLSNREKLVKPPPHGWCAQVTTTETPFNAERI